MPSDWQQHCPIDEGESPVEREAWRKGWAHRKSPSEDTSLNAEGTPLLLAGGLKDTAQQTNTSGITEIELIALSPERAQSFSI